MTFLKKITRTVIRWFAFSDDTKGDSKSLLKHSDVAQKDSQDLKNDKLFSSLEPDQQNKAPEWYRLHI